MEELMSLIEEVLGLFKKADDGCIFKRFGYKEPTKEQEAEAENLLKAQLMASVIKRGMTLEQVQLVINVFGIAMESGEAIKAWKERVLTEKEESTRYNLDTTDWEKLLSPELVQIRVRQTKWYEEKPDLSINLDSPIGGVGKGVKISREVVLDRTDPKYWRSKESGEGWTYGDSNLSYDVINTLIKTGELHTKEELFGGMQTLHMEYELC